MSKKTDLDAVIANTTRLIETIEWIPVVEEMPDADLVVLASLSGCNEPVWLAYFDSSDECWRTVSGGRIPTVTHWAEVPNGVQANS